MRPVKLEMHGFAAFRDRTTVDFTDADYFALVGPTGSGKSTVLDAITFALYGSVPRWKDQKVTHLAMAPTTNQCKVSLIFDIGTVRYRIARELRRNAKSITQKVSLVQYADPLLVEIGPEDPPAEVLAGEVRALDKLLPELLGLSFADFCQCVVLPQGEFATFLGADSDKRHKTLIKLLGGERYGEIARLAGMRARQAGTEVEVLTEQLGTHSDATPEAEAAATATAALLATVLAEVETVATTVRSARADATTAEARSAQHIQNLEALAAIEVPDGITELQTSAAAAKNALDTALAEAEKATAVLTRATEAARSVPQRATLEQAGERYQEQATLLGDRDATAAGATAAASAVAATAAALEESETQLAQTAAVAEEAKASLAAALEEQGTLKELLQQVTEVEVPDVLADLAGRSSAAAAADQAANAGLVAARAALEEAEAELAAAPAVNWFAQTRAEIEQVEATGQKVGAADAVLAAAIAVQSDLDQAQSSAEDEAARAQQAVEAAAAGESAALLRSRLEVGQSCPVCDQHVTVIPAAHDHDTAALRSALAEATTKLNAAERARHQGLVTRTKAEAELSGLLERAAEAESRLGALLPARPAGEDRDLVADLAHVEELALAQATSSQRVSEARAAVVAADQELARATAEVAAVEKDLGGYRAELHILLGALRQLEPPAVDPADLAAAWASLVTWAEKQATDLATRAAEAETRVAEQKVVLGEAEAALTEATTARRAAQEASTQAVLAEAAATGALTTLTNRLAELAGLLADAPAALDLPALLEESARLDAAITEASTQVTNANDLAAEARAGCQEWEAKVSAARAVLGAARDSVAVLTPPVLPVEDLDAAWAQLATWAAETVEGQRASLEKSAAAGAEAHRVVAESEARVTMLMDEHGLSDELVAGADVPLAAPQVVAVALERAKGRAAAIAKSLEQLAGLEDKISAATEEQQVAQQLAALLRKDKFPEWLAAAALDVLVAGASETLRELSGNQFDLTHKNGDFYVIDHSDADSERSVRTLSGGETFQASLALALALAEQLRGLGSSARLESIFLDEGFGTLDPDALEVVAGTLENLADGKRMVGVITHVAALAERVPVRFEVTNDTRTSSVTREG